MEVIKKNLKNLDEIGLRLDKIKGKSYDDIQKILINQKLYNHVNVFINSIQECKADSRMLLTAFAMKFHMGCMVNDVNLKENQEIYQLITLTLDEYESLFKGELTKEIVNKFCKRLNLFNEEFIKWKKQDLFKVIEEYAKMFWTLEMQKRNKEITDEQKKIIIENQQKIKKLVEQIGGKEGIEQFEKYSPVMFDESDIKDQVKSTFKKAYWDKLVEDLDNKKYDSILLILKEIRARIALLVPNRIDIHQKLGEYIDIEFIKQMLNHNVIDSKFIYNLVHYIIDKIKEMESPIYNKDTEKWREEINQLFENKMKHNDIFPIFFQKVFDKIEQIEKETKIVKESELYKEIKKR
jgi:hypothetical protein